MNALSRIFSLAAATLAIFSLPACSETDSSVGGSATPLQTECKVGESKKAPDGCNTCTCQQNGFFACTEMACAPAGECKAGESKKADDGCNTCTCGADGKWACTLLGCPEPQCKTGESKKADDGCNTCSCGPDGTWACTEKACPSPECKVGETKMADDGCNKCSCGPDGTWACTQLGCAPECKVDADCPAPPPFCNLCSDGSSACPAAACVGGVCSIINDKCAGPVAPGQPCSKPGSQAPADDGCNTCTCGDTGTWGCTKIACVSCEGPVPPCPAPPAGCDYVGGGCVDGQWTCGNLVCDTQCKSNSDCPQPGAPCQLCADGSTVCPSVDCVAGQCLGSFPTCPAPEPCATQQAKGDGLCDAFFGYAWDGASCNAVSGCSCVGSDCNNLYKTPDDCKLDHQACGSGSQCKADSDCPQPGAPCFDAVCKAGMCTLVDTCTSSSCKVDSDCPQPDGPCVKCLGTNPCAKAICDLGACTEIPPICGDVCPAQDAAGQGACDMFLGFSWNGKECVGLGGCGCVGNDCGNLYKSQAICLSIHSACQIPQ